VTSVARYAYAILAWVFLVGLLFQVFLAGLGMFADAQSLRLHGDFGWALHLAPLLIVVAAFAARAGRRHWLWALALAVVVFLVPVFVLLRSSMPAVAALHPVAAMLAFGIAAMVARNSLLGLRRPSDSSSAAV